MSQNNVGTIHLSHTLNYCINSNFKATRVHRRMLDYGSWQRICIAYFNGVENLLLEHLALAATLIVRMQKHVCRNIIYFARSIVSVVTATVYNQPAVCVQRGQGRGVGYIHVCVRVCKYICIYVIPWNSIPFYRWL